MELGIHTSRICCFCCCETHKFSSTEGKCCNNKHGAEALETICESSGIVPVFCTKITLWPGPTTIDNYTEDDETDTASDFDDREDEFN